MATGIPSESWSALLALADASDAIILLEGTRTLPVEQVPVLAEVAEKLARALPRATFRTGNAIGSDSAFAAGIVRVDAARLEYIIPNSGMGRGRVCEGARVISLSDLPHVAEPTLLYHTKRATPGNSGLIDFYERGTAGRPRQMAKYLVRDTLKVTGAAQLNLLPATIGIFYVNPLDPEGGGTGHTIRVCRQCGVLVLTQDEWRGWIA